MIPRAEIPELTLLEMHRFFAKVEIVGTGDAGCWEWTGAKDQHGYGRFGVRRKNRRAHVIAYMLERGPVPAGMDLDHLCCNRSCVRPDHLELVSHQENLRRTMTEACGRGHALTPDNVYLTEKGHRQCRTCRKLRRSRKVLA